MGGVSAVMQIGHDLGQKVDPQSDQIRVHGKVIQTHQDLELLYILLNKPMGVVSTCIDPQGRPTVLDMLPKKLGQNTGLHPVGRLDRDSTGALLTAATVMSRVCVFELASPSLTVNDTVRVAVFGLSLVFS